VLNSNTIYCSIIFSNRSESIHNIYKRRWVSSAMLRRVVWQKFTDVSEVLATSIIRALQHPKIQSPSYLPPWEHEVSINLYFFIKQIKCENTFTTTEARFLPNAPTQNRPSVCRLLPHVGYTRPHHRRHHSLVCISCYRSRCRQNLISFFSALNERRTRAVKRDGHWILYYE
jgi:hypothetical protein